MRQLELSTLFRSISDTVNENGTYINLNGKTQDSRRFELSQLTQNSPLPVIALMNVRTTKDPTQRTNGRHQVIILFLDQSNPGIASDNYTKSDIEESQESITDAMELIVDSFLTALMMKENARGKYILDGGVELSVEKNVLATTLSGVSIRFTLNDLNRC